MYMKATHMLRQIEMMVVALCWGRFVIAMKKVSLEIGRASDHATVIFVLMHVDKFRGHLSI